MGRAKALLPAGNTPWSFLQTLAAALRAGGAADILVVGREDDDRLQHEAASMEPPARYVPNPDARLGQLSSVIAGLNVADRPGTRGVMIAPVDVPLVTPDTISALLAAFSSTHAPIVRPVTAGRHGHPVIFSRMLFDELRHADPAAGARAIVHEHAAEIFDVDVNDPGVLVDIDTPEDYARVFGRSLP